MKVQLYIDPANMLSKVPYQVPNNIHYVRYQDFLDAQTQPDALTAYLYAAELAKGEIKRLKAEVERLKEGNECLDQMHEKEMARSAFLCEQVERLTKAVMHSPAAQLKLKELEGKTTYEEINPDNDYARLKAEVERLKQQVNYYAIEAKDFEDKWLTAIEVVTNLMKPRSEVGLVPPCIDKYEAK